MSHEPWPNGPFPIDRASASQRVSKVRSSLPWRSLLEELLLLGSVSRHGFRTIDLHGEPPRYRNLPTVHAEQAVSELPVSTPATEATPTCSRLTDGADGEPNSTRREHQAHGRAQRQGLNPNPS